MEFFTSSDLTVTTVRHNREEVKFDVKYLTASKNVENIAGRTDPFLEFSNYVNTKPLQWQDTLFEKIKDLRRAVDEIYELPVLFDELNEILISIYKDFDIPEMEKWIRYNSGVIIPHELKDNMAAISDTSKVTENRTYFRQDYYDLITYALALRPAALILGEYIVRSDKETGTVWKDSEAYRLLFGTKIFEYKAVERLRIYVSETIDKEKNSKDRSLDAAILSSISIDDFPEYILGFIITKKVSLCDISGRNPKLNPIKVIFKTENQKLAQLDKAFLGGKLYVKQKPKDKANISENNSSSVLEAYKARQAIPDDVPITISYYLEDPHRVLRDIDPNVPTDLVDDLLPELKVMAGVDIKEAQTILVRLMINKVIPAQAVPYLSRDDLIKVMAVAGALLWYYGFYEFALIVTGKVLDQENEMMLIGDEKRERLKDDMKNELLRKYPYSSTNRNKTQKINMSIISSIDSLEQKMHSHSWQCQLPKKWLAQANLPLQHGCYGIQKNIRHRLGALFLLLADVVPDDSSNI